MSLLSLKNVSQQFVDNQGRLVHALKDINLDVNPGELVAIIGPSGCGKTTMLRIISGLAKPKTGRVVLKDHEVTKPGVHIGYVFQHGSLFPWETIKQNIGSGLKAVHGNDYDRSLVDKYLQLMGLSRFANAYPHQISGGMAQRAALARSIIMKPELLLLDEPMGALDAFTRADIQGVIYRIWHKSKMTMILVTHDINEAVYLSSRIVIMTPRPGRIKDVIQNNLKFPRDRNSDAFFKMSRQVRNELKF
ncbi:ABC transporter ATP-binding protein [Acetilactobacillus jinshanensis]|uniref:ABC transporter ATP-binding protein n=1 Tax=Acetilactobacillus jinshanensis TaxID=1720083 RepID=A0A4P6ZKZ0_9LACO|nr:ABC transporter ATP-binding protein [Acetilactobacillus jinshanensis]QBP18374.1 ABC transporter ATP-binding protein [Acetilactobacillus jinshanensis]URL61239.1 ABC transporter ATP-binding protein [uncultured bacterium]